MEIIIAIASKIGEVIPIGTEFGYLINYHSNLESLKPQFGVEHSRLFSQQLFFKAQQYQTSPKGEIKKLFDKKDGVQGLVDAAKRNGEIIKPDVQSWLKNVNDDMVKKVSQFEDEINKKRRCVYRWSLSRKAHKIKQDVLDLQNKGFENVAHPAPPPEIWSTFEKGFKDFKSREANMNEVIEGLKRVEVRMIGICGMGGVGKTTMVKEIITRLAKLNLFDKIVMATVSQSPSIRTIQSEIADEIGLEFKVESESGRARKLHERLMEIKRILIVLDDVWTEPNFEAIGLHYGDTPKGCKILLTSRDSEVCNRMGSQQIIAVPTLTTEESQELFREMVGESFNDPDLRSTAEDVVKECGGLPIAIVTVGKALEKKNKREWDDALNQLRNSRPENIPRVNDKVYSCIKWSYDRLESDEARSCLLLCCLFPEDYDIPIEYLVRYGWGRGYFSSVVTLEDARNRVHYLVDQLKRRFLLLDSYVSEATKMHDVVRDVAISIASRDPHGFLISNAENKRWPNLATYDHYTTISLVGKLEIPVGLKCPKLELLQKMKGRFSEGSMDIISHVMKELKASKCPIFKGCVCFQKAKDVYAFPKPTVPSASKAQRMHPFVQHCVCNTKAVSDKDATFFKVASVSKKRQWSKIDGMSTDVIGSLENLEILSFRGCVSLREFPREIRRLKQLRLSDTTDCRNLEVIPHGIFSSLCRLEELYMLNSFTKWEIGRGREEKGMASISEVMSLSHHLKVLAINIPGVIHLLPKDRVWKSPTIRFDLDQEGFQDLKILLVLNCPNTEYLANGTSVTQQKLFPLIQSMEEIVSKQGREHEEEADMISFHKLTNLSLWGLPSLVGFFQANKLYSNQEETTPRVEHQSAGIFEKAIFPSKCISWLPSLEKGFQNLRYLKLRYCYGPEYVFSHLIARELLNLEEVTPTNLGDSNDNDNLENLIVRDCASLEVIFQLKGPKHEESSHSVEAFNKLRSLRLHKLPSLTCAWETGSSQPMFTGSSFGNLKSLQVDFCNQLKYLFSSFIVKLLVSIEEIEVKKCEQMEEIVAAEEETDEIITLPKVKSIKLQSLPKLNYFCGDAYTLKLSSLELLEVKKVQNLRRFAPKLVDTHPRLQVRTALGVAEWKEDLNATLRNIYDTSKDEDDELDSEDEDDELNGEDEDDEIDGEDDDDKIDGKDEDDEVNRDDEHN
ncbi:unnamed protein product [Malus baccata var. baccata]